MAAKTAKKTEHERNVEKQMGGCMSGFFNLFDRSHRLYPKRLPPPVNDASSELKSKSLIESPALSKDSENIKPPPQPRNQPEKVEAPAVPLPAKVELPAEMAAVPWKFAREAPRLSLDSRAVRDAKGGLRPREIRIKTASSASDDNEDSDYNRRSPSLVARLMGLEPLPSLSSSSEQGYDEPDKKVQLRRSTSECRSKEYYRFGDTPSFLSPVGNNRNDDDDSGERKLDQSVAVDVHRLQQRQRQTVINNTRKSNNISNSNNSKMRRTNLNNKNNNNNNQRKLAVERRSYYDTADIFPPEVMVKQQHQPVTVYGEIERRLRMKGIDEPSKDLETLKHILEALQLKGLLHSSSSTTSATNSRKNVVYDRSFFLREEESLITKSSTTRPMTSPSSTPRRRQHQSVASNEPLVSPRKERTAKSPSRGENRCLSPVSRRKAGLSSVETTVRSPRMTRRSDQTVSRSPRNRKSTAEICQGSAVQCGGPVITEDEMSTVSGSSLSTSSYTDERWRVEEHRDGRNLLKRCDKLLNSIAEITTNSSTNSNSTELQQPSPVSVLDSSFYKEDESSPSPVKKRTIDFKDEAVIEMDDELWSPLSSSTRLLKFDHDIDSSDDSELSYISEVIRASHYFPEDSNLFLLLEKQSSTRKFRKNNSKVSILERKLVFDTITEILDRNTHLPPWKVASVLETTPMSDQIWSEFQKIRDHDPSEDLFEVVCGVLKKDLAGDSTNGWVGFPVEMSEAVLDIERLVFKDLIGEIIRDLASVAEKNMRVQAHRRKLVF